MHVTCDRRTLSDFVSGCQEFAGRISDADSETIARSLLALARTVGPDCPIHERLAVRYLFGNAVARIAKSSGIEHRTEFADAVLEWHLADIAACDWHLCLQRLSTLCADMVAQSPTVSSTTRSMDPRVSNILGIIAERYTDPHLRLTDITKQAGVSLFYAARMVRRETGSTIAAHIHRLRIRAAEQKLRRSSLSIKQIAAQVGYATPSQFGRMFRRLTGITPQAFRVSTRTHCN